jgi:DNA-binding SARP family transcriptional activator
MPIEPIILRTLGTAQVDIGRTQVRPNAVRRFSVLLYLSAEVGRRVSRRCLIDLLFPEQTEKNGLHSLRELLYKLKSAGVALDADQEGIELPVGAVRADYAEMLASERLTLEQIRAAQGGFLPGYAPHESEAYTEWFEPFRARTAFALSQVLLRAQARAQDVGNLELSEAAARACLAISPLNERAVRGLAETMALGGAKMEAVSLLANYAAEVGSRSSTLGHSAELFKNQVMERLPDRRSSTADLPFAGRDTEMLELQRRFAISTRGGAQCVLLVGEPGIGKTRLALEFGTLAKMEGTHLAMSAAGSNDRWRPMSVFVDLVPRLLRVRGAIGIAPGSVDALARLTGRDTSFTESSLSDPQAVSSTMTRAVEDLIAAICGETHLTIIVEDAHWADALSLRVIARLIQGDHRRLLVVVTSRDRKLKEIIAPTPDSFACLELQPLTQDISRDIARRALKRTVGESHEALHDWMAETSNGHPLFISALIAHFAATAEPFAVPQNLQELLRRRLERLDSKPTLVLQTCALLGSLATLPRVTECLELPYADTVLAIAQLEAAHTLKWTDGKLLPAHALIADSLLQRTVEPVKALLHMRIARILELELATAESPAVLWSCADHWIAAGDHHRALRLLHKCADHARQIGRPSYAAQILLRGASMHVENSARVEALREAITLANAAHETDLAYSAIKLLRQIDPCARHDDIELAELHVLSVTHRDSPDYEQRVLAYLEDNATRSEYRVRAGLAALQYADNHDKVELAGRVRRAVSAADLDAVDEILSLGYRLVYETAFGDVLEGARIARRLRGLSDGIPGAIGAGIRFNATIALIRVGATDEAFAACEEVYELSRTCGAIKLQMAAALQLAVILVDKGKLDESKAWRSRTQLLLEKHGQVLDGFEAYAHEVDFCLIEGDVVRAQEVLRKSEHLELFTSPVRRRWHRYLRARLTQVRVEKSISQDELDELIREGNDCIPTSGIRDLEIAVICAAFCKKGDRLSARAALRGFLSSRCRLRDLPIAPHLRFVISACGLEADTQNASSITPLHESAAS